MCIRDSFEYAEEVRDKFRELGGKTAGNNFVNDKFSDLTTARRDKAYEARKKYRLDNPLSKAYIKYPANLMVCDVGDTKYHLLKSF